VTACIRRKPGEAAEPDVAIEPPATALDADPLSLPQTEKSEPATIALPVPAAVLPLPVRQPPSPRFREHITRDRCQQRQLTLF
jgi:hypothetical protein